MSYIKIGNKLLSPAPLITVNKTLAFTNDGQPISSDFAIELQGTLLPHVGSPASTGWTLGDGIPGSESFVTDNDKLEALLKKQDLLREAFDIAGVPITYKASGFDEVSFYGNLQGINFSPNPWVIRSDYVIQLRTHVLNKVNSSGIEDQFLVRTSGLNLKSVGDTWAIATSPESTGLYQVTRTTSAVGAAYINSGIVQATSGTEAWLNARRWVIDRITQYPVMTYSYLFPSGYNATGYNSIREESIDTLGGGYTLSQKYTFGQTSYTEQQNITKTLIKDLLDDGGPTVLNINVGGNIIGYHPSNIPSGRLEAARTRYTAISGGIAAAVGANGPALTSSVNESTYDGTLSYTFEFTNNLGSTYKHVYDVSATFGDNNPTVVINGTIEGVSPDALPLGKFNAAASGWAVIQPTLKTLAFAYGTGVVFGYSNFPDYFSNIPTSINTAFNKANGTIQYNQTYVFGSGTSSLYNESYTLDLNTSNSAGVDVVGTTCIVSIAGTITGLAADGNPTTKNTNAAAGFAVARPLAFPRCSGYYAGLYPGAPPLSSGVLSQSVTNNRIAGSYAYNIVFSNQPRGSGESANAVVVVEEIFNRDTIVFQAIPGRAEGPILQNLNTKSERGRNISVQLTMKPKSGGGYWTYQDVATPRALCSGYFFGIMTPHVRGTDYFLTNRTESWNYQAGEYNGSFSIAWTSGILY